MKGSPQPNTDGKVPYLVPVSNKDIFIKYFEIFMIVIVKLTT